MPHRSLPTNPPRGRHASPYRSVAPRRSRKWPLALLVSAALALTLLALPSLSSAVGSAWATDTRTQGAAATKEAGTARDADPTRQRASRADRYDERKRRAAQRAAAKRAAASASASSTAAGSSSASASATSSAPASSTQTTTSSAGTSSSSGTTTGTANALLPYSLDSYFRKPLPSVTPVSPDSASIVAFAKANDPFDYLKIRGAHGVGWGIATAVADCSDPIYRIGSSGNVPASQQHLRTVGFHAPASVWSDIPPNGDAPFLVVDTCGTSARPGGLSVWGANTAVSGQTVTVSAAGSFAHDTNGLDRRNPRSNSQLNERSRGVIPDSMAIRLDVLEQAIRSGTGLGHVLEVFWVETNSAAGFAHPMVGAESGKSGAGAEGQRMRIKPGIDLAARPGCNPSTNPVGLAIARTLQQHGAYLGDNSGSGSGIKTEQNANFPGLDADSLSGCMTWDDVEFLPPGWDG